MSMHYLDMIFHDFQFWRINSLDKLSVLDTLFTCWLSLQSGLDLLISGTFISQDLWQVWICYSGIMVTRLYTSRTRFRQTNTVIYRLIRASVETGIFCTIFAMGDMISFRKTSFLETMLANLALYIVAMPRSHLCGMFVFPIGRIYTNVSIFQSFLSANDETSDLLDSYGLFKHAGEVERYVGRTTSGLFLFPLLISRVWRCAEQFPTCFNFWITFTATVTSKRRNPWRTGWSGRQQLHARPIEIFYWDAQKHCVCAIQLQPCFFGGKTQNGPRIWIHLIYLEASHNYPNNFVRPEARLRKFCCLPAYTW